MKEAIYQECRKQQEASSPLHKALEQAQKTPQRPEVQVNQEKALRIQLEG